MKSYTTAIATPHRGAGITDLLLSISVQGDVVVSEDFDSAAEAAAFFNDQAMDLGPIADHDPTSSGVLDIDISMQITSNTQNSGFYGGIVVADPPPGAAPEDMVVGTARADTFVFPVGFGDLSIYNFDTAHDVVQVDAALFADFTSLMSHATSVDGDTVITAGPDQVLTINNVAPGQLRANLRGTGLSTCSAGCGQRQIVSPKRCRLAARFREA